MDHHPLTLPLSPESGGEGDCGTSTLRQWNGITKNHVPVIPRLDRGIQRSSLRKPVQRKYVKEFMK